MKKMLFMGSLCALLLSLGACSENKAESGTHSHEDGSTHGDHAADTTKPQQQEFTIGDSVQVDTSVKEGVHAHEDGKQHSH